jgi:hypothetical protein
VFSRSPKLTPSLKPVTYLAEIKMATGLTADVRYPTEVRYLYLLRRVQTGCVSYPVCSGSSILTAQSVVPCSGMVELYRSWLGAQPIGTALPYLLFVIRLF